MQRSFSELEYASKKKVTRRDRFLGEINAVTPWSALVAEVEPFYPKESKGIKGARATLTSTLLIIIPTSLAQLHAR